MFHGNESLRRFSYASEAQYNRRLQSTSYLRVSSNCLFEVVAEIYNREMDSVILKLGSDEDGTGGKSAKINRHWRWGAGSSISNSCLIMTSVASLLASTCTKSPHKSRFAISLFTYQSPGELLGVMLFLPSPPLFTCFVLSARLRPLHHILQQDTLTHV